MDNEDISLISILIIWIIVYQIIFQIRISFVYLFYRAEDPKKKKKMSTVRIHPVGLYFISEKVEQKNIFLKISYAIKKVSNCNLD